MKLKNTRLGSYNGIKVGAVIDVKEDEVQNYLDLGFTKVEGTNESPDVGDSGTSTKKIADAKVEAEKLISDAKLEAEKIKNQATEDAEKIVSDAKVTPEVTGDVTTETKDKKATEKTQK